MARGLIVVGLCAVTWMAAQAVAPAQSQDRSALPEGYYLFLGTAPGESEGKWLVINPDGKVSWLADKTVGSAAKETGGARKVHSSSGAKRKDSGSSQASDSQFDTYDYPHIKWKAKSFLDAPPPLPVSFARQRLGMGVETFALQRPPSDAIVQLVTTFEAASDSVRNGRMKYILTVFKAIPRNCEVQLLDKSGFKVVQFTASDFHVISPNLVEARADVSCSEDDYKQARDYSVKWLN